MSSSEPHDSLTGINKHRETAPPWLSLWILNIVLSLWLVKDKAQENKILWGIGDQDVAVYETENLRRALDSADIRLAEHILSSLGCSKSRTLAAYAE